MRTITGIILGFGITNLVTLLVLHYGYNLTHETEAYFLGAGIATGLIGAADGILNAIRVRKS